MKAKDIMTTDILTVSLKTSIKKLAALLLDNGISGAPVVDEHEKLIGIVTEGDLIYQKKKLHLNQR
jgi:CBS domain-containing protein